MKFQRSLNYNLVKCQFLMSNQNSNGNGSHEKLHYLSAIFLKKKIDTVNHVFLFTLPDHPFLAVEHLVLTKIYWEAPYLKPVSLELSPGYAGLFRMVLLPNLEGLRTSWPCCWCLWLSYGEVVVFMGNPECPEVPWMDVDRLYGYSDFLEYI